MVVHPGRSDVDPDTGLPVHLGIPVTEDGQGPVDVDSPEFSHHECWCGDRSCDEFIREGTIFDPERVPSRDLLGPAQTWAWMGGARTPHWRICGMGAMLDGWPSVVFPKTAGNDTHCLEEDNDT